jgi:hypothetical protein
MPTNRKRRTRQIIKKELSFSVKYYLENGCYPPRELFPSRPGLVELFMMRHPNHAGDLEKVWFLHRDEILKDWKAEKQKGKPWAEKHFRIDEKRK